MSGDAYFRETQTARSTERRHRENRGRLAVSTASYVSTGVGVVQFDEMAQFDCRYIRRPNFTSGVYFDVDEWQALVDPEEEGGTVPWPMVTAYVLEWVTDNGFYVGAFVGAQVEFLTAEPFIGSTSGLSIGLPEEDPTQADQFRVEYCFRFEEVAIKGGGGDDSTGGGPGSGEGE